MRTTSPRTRQSAPGTSRALSGRAPSRSEPARTAGRTAGRAAAAPSVLQRGARSVCRTFSAFGTFGAPMLPPGRVTTHRRWHNWSVDSDGQLDLYRVVADQLKA